VSGDAYLRADVAAAVQRRLTRVEGVGYDADRMVCAVVSGAGALVDLMFHPAAQALGPNGLGEAIVAAAWNAQADARQRGYTMLALALGDEAAAAVEAVDSPAPARAAGWDTVARFAAPQSTAAPEPTVAPQPAAALQPITAPQPTAATEPIISPETTAARQPAADEDDLATFDPSIFRSDR
jgi:hypothetical protein